MSRLQGPLCRTISGVQERGGSHLDLSLRCDPGNRVLRSRMARRLACYSRPCRPEITAEM
jgi:hypothetical protein